jgi:hypothetical protein
VWTLSVVLIDPAARVAEKFGTGWKVVIYKLKLPTGLHSALRLLVSMNGHIVGSLKKVDPTYVCFESGELVM